MKASLFFGENCALFPFPPILTIARKTNNATAKNRDFLRKSLSSAGNCQDSRPRGRREARQQAAIFRFMAISE
jgi:hypothetical protein